MPSKKAPRQRPDRVLVSFRGCAGRPDEYPKLDNVTAVVFQLPDGTTLSVSTSVRHGSPQFEIVGNTGLMFTPIASNAFAVASAARFNTRSANHRCKHCGLRTTNPDGVCATCASRKPFDPST